MLLFSKNNVDHGRLNATFVYASFLNRLIHPPCTQRDRGGRRRRLVDRNARAANGGGGGDGRRDSPAVSRRQAGADGSAKEVIERTFVRGRLLK